MVVKINTFTKHPKDVDTTYLQHLRFAINHTRLTFKACLASLVPAFLPFMFVNTASRINLKLFYMLKSRMPEDRIGQINFQGMAELSVDKIIHSTEYK